MPYRKNFLWILLSFFISSPSIAGYHFKPLPKRYIDRLGDSEREYYINKIGTILVKFEERENSRSRFANNFLTHPILGGVAHAASAMCAVGDRDVPKVQGRCSIKNNPKYSNCNRNSSQRSWKCGAAFGGLCVTYQNYDISKACFETAKKQNKLNPYRLLQSLEKHCGNKKKSDNCKYAHKAIIHVNNLVKSNLFDNQEISEAKCGGVSSFDSQFCKVCLGGYGEEEDYVCSKNNVNRSVGKDLSRLLNLGLISTKGLKDKFSSSTLFQRACGNVQSKSDLMKQQRIIKEKLEIFDRLGSSCATSNGTRTNQQSISQ